MIAEEYVLPERRPALDSVLAQGLASGRYDVTQPAALAERITEDLRATARDRHLYLNFDPRQAAILSAQNNATKPDPSGLERQVRATNHGVTELRVLPGNIRYMAFTGGHWIGAESAAAIDAAMRFLAGGEAIIIDIRNHRGGSAEPAKHILSHFMPANQPLYTFYEKGETNRVFTLPTVPAGRMIGKPLYILTGPSTASAAEELAGNVAGFRIGEVIGETTAGAGFMNALEPIGGVFVLSVSIARVVLASTGRDWEALGIAPTIRTPVPQALDAAQAHALRRIAATAPAEERPRLEAMAEGFAARLDARTPALPLPAYAGRFGERTVIEEGGKLYYQRANGPRTLLIPLGGNRFAFDNDMSLQLEFTPTGEAASAFTIRRPGTAPQGTYDRTP